MADWFDIDAEPQPTNDARPPERELVPEGTHDFQIKAVIDEAERIEIRLAHEDRRYGWVFVRLPKEAKWAARIAKTLAEALAIPPGGFQAAIESGDLAGRRVRARVYHRVLAIGGKTFVNVGEFHAIEQLAEEAAAVKAPPAAKAKPARTATQKADAAASMPDDDIPF